MYIYVYWEVVVVDLDGRKSRYVNWSCYIYIYVMPVKSISPKIAFRFCMSAFVTAFVVQHGK